MNYIGSYLTHDSSYLVSREMIIDKVPILVDLRVNLLEEMELGGDEGFIEYLGYERIPF